jgi:Mn2+/Fe2+ NRAMP family transporter
VPTFSGDASFWAMVVAILGTTISPYLLFWQASQEAEDIKVLPRRKPLLSRPRQAPDAFNRIRMDTYIGMGLSNVVGLAIIITTAATLHASRSRQAEPDIANAKRKRSVDTAGKSVGMRIALRRRRRTRAGAPQQEV